MSDNAQAGPSTVAPTKIKGKKGQAGGLGKKRNKFVEDKSALLSLISDVTASQDTVRDGKLAKHRSYNPQPEPFQEEGGKRVKVVKQVTPSEKRKREKNRALAEAKVAIAAKAKEKKKRKTISEDSSSTSTKKRVGFA